MKIEIKMLDVGDGDAIIVRMERDNGEKFVGLIDGGRSKNFDQCKDALKETLDSAGKSGPDLIICTHYDADHIGGLKQIASFFGTAIGEVWIHEPGIIAAASDLAERLLTESHANQKTSPDILEYRQFLGQLTLDDARDLTFESYQQMKDLVTFLKDNGIKTVQPFAGHFHPQWPEIKVLGPSEQFYNSCLDKISDPNQLLEKEAELLLNESNKSPFITSMQEFNSKTDDPCKFLAEQRKDHVTEVNQVSIIIMITVEDKRYLFTGDASMESFYNLPGYPDCISKLYWLKVAHHGSHNNSSPELFDIMKPEYADVSGGKRYLDDEVPDCLEARGVKVRTTRDNGDLLFPY